ncbi:MAG: serine hydrolase [Bacilli bacterium]|nr:serine hydrolase [Bacilli bacterium]
MKQIKEFKNHFILGLKVLFTNHIFQITTLTLSFILVSVVVYKALNLRNKVDKYEDIENQIEEKMETEIKINYQEKNNTSQLTGAAALSSCLKQPLTEEEITDELLKMTKSLEDIFNSSNYNFAFKYKDIYTGFSISYNSSQPIFAASTIKAPEAIYIYEQAEKGTINLNDTITYTSGYYSNGTGVLKNTKFGVDYTIRKLVSYSIIHSDNAAHLMLNNKYKSDNMYNYWTNLGTNTIFKSKGSWGNITADDATIYMEELYKYYINNNQYSEELLNYFTKSWKVISTPNNNLKIASKSGWSKNSLHDTALIFDENPYTLVILTNRGYVDYQSFFNKVSTLIYNFHKEYWNEKTKLCNN